MREENQGTPARAKQSWIEGEEREETHGGGWREEGGDRRTVAGVVLIVHHQGGGDSRERREERGGATSPTTMGAAQRDRSSVLVLPHTELHPELLDNKQPHWLTAALQGARRERQ